MKLKTWLHEPVQRRNVLGALAAVLIGAGWTYTIAQESHDKISAVADHECAATNQRTHSSNVARWAFWSHLEEAVVTGKVLLATSPSSQKAVREKSIAHSEKLAEGLTWIRQTNCNNPEPEMVHSFTNTEEPPNDKAK